MSKKPESLPVQKTSQRGKYVYKPITSIIVLCSCGGKYVMTRKGQTTCIRCIQEK